VAWRGVCDEMLLSGHTGMVDLTGIVGYYTMPSIVMNGACTPPPFDIGSVAD
jgi:hypothetical protein